MRFVTLCILTTLAALGLTALTFAADPGTTKTPGYIGVEVGDVSKEDADKLKWDEPTGVKVVKPQPGSPGETAGLKPGDIIVSVDGQELTGPGNFIPAMSNKGAGATVKLKVLHDGVMRTVTVTLTARPTNVVSTPTDGPPPLPLMLDTGGHTALVKGLAWSPDAKLIFSSAEDKVIRVWDVETGKTVRTIRGEVGTGPEGKLYAMAVSPDGKLLASGGWLTGSRAESDGVRIFDVASGRQLKLLLGHTNVVLGLAFSPDGKRLVSTSGDGIGIIWDVATGEKIRELKGHSGEVYGVAFTPDGKRIATGSFDRTAKLWDASTGAVIKTLIGHKDRIHTLVINKKDGTIVTGSYDGDIRIWDGTNGNLIKVLGNSGSWVSALAISPDGTKIVTACGGGPPCAGEPQIMWDVKTGQRLAEPHFHDNVVIASSISPDGRWVATAGGSSNEIKIWAPGKSASEIPIQKLGEGGAPLALKGTGTPVWGVGFSQDGKRIGWTSVPHSGGNGISRLEFSLTLPTGGDEVPAPIVMAEAVSDQEDAPKTSAMGLDNSKTASAAPAPVPTASPAKPAGPVYVPSEWRRSVVSQGGITIAHKRKPGEFLDSQLVVTRNDKVIAIIERENYNGDDHRAYTLSPDGKWIVTGGAFGVLQAFNLADLEAAAKELPEKTVKADELDKLAINFLGHQGDIWGVAVSPDGRTLISGANDQTVRLWNMKTGAPIITIFRGGNGEWVAWTDQGYFTGSPGAGDIVGWQLNQGRTAEARYISGGQLRKQFERPDIVAKAIQLANAEEAVTGSIHTDYKLSDLLERPVPKVRIISPAPDIKISNTIDSRLEFEVDGRAVSWRASVNGTRIDGGSLKTNSVSIPLPLYQGDNLIEVVVTSADGVESNLQEGGRIHVTLQGSGSLNTHDTLHIIAIGVNSYPGLGTNCRTKDGKPRSCDLQFATADAVDLAAAIAKRLGPWHKAVAKPRILVNRPGYEPPTRANILDALSEVQANAGPNDTVVLFAAGHGEDRAGGYLFMPTDAEWQNDHVRLSSVLDWTEMQKLVANTKGRRIMFLDTCNSGNAPNSAIASEALNQDIVAFTATDARQHSLEKGQPIDHGLFSYLLIQALTQGIESSEEHVIRVGTLATYLRSQTAQLVRAEFPGMPDFDIPVPQLYRGRDAKDYEIARWQ